ncbi:hypothetical protein CEXT_198711 [Caerostris extrusa]|uniref:ATP synthase F0 subunit 8 n=1 Tax=Caerostris extrusa TaxID=172846 RepID=A0AAV4X973_CAEEX|nr:hypothetical protein CEXT_198711 [Caerostris extrusa]
MADLLPIPEHSQQPWSMIVGAGLISAVQFISLRRVSWLITQSRWGGGGEAPANSPKVTWLPCLCLIVRETRVGSVLQSGDLSCWLHAIESSHPKMKNGVSDKNVLKKNVVFK